MAKIDKLIEEFWEKWKHTIFTEEVEEEMRADLEAIIKTATKEYIKKKDLVRFEIEPGSLDDWTPDY